ncbi:MAG: TIM-barrel domain-containing protein [Kiritimatiellia bacterium]
MKLKHSLLVLSAASFLSAFAWEGSVNGNRLACDFVADGIVRVQFALGDKLQDNATGVVLPSRRGADRSDAVTTGRKGTTVVLSGGGLTVTIDAATGRVVFSEAASGRVLLAESATAPHAGEPITTEKIVYDEQSARTVHTANGDVIVKDVKSRKPGEKSTRYQVRFDWQQGEALYGLGQHIEDYLDLRGKEQFLTQHNLKAMVPVLVSTAGYGLLFDAGSAMRFDDRDGAGLFEVSAAKELDYYFLYGGNLDGVIAKYRELTGACPMMPRYAFGYVQSKERYRSSDDILKTLKRYRELGVPLDVIVQDWNYWPQGWGYMKMNPKRYPDCAALARGVHDLNAKLMVSIWPNPQKCPEADDFRRRGWMLPFDFYNAFNPDARSLYWKYANDEFFANGFDAWWCDCSEPNDADWKDMPKGYGMDSAKERWEQNSELLADTLGVERSSLYSLYHAQGIYEHQRAATDRKRVLNLTRSSYAGQQRYSTFTWNGDTAADWASFKRQIPSGLNFMATGCPYWTVDAGCFFVGERKQWFWQGKFKDGVKDPAYREYYTRMLQWAAYLPMMRSHGTDTPREIWHFGERGTPYFDAIEKAIRGRYELLPYIYSVAAMVTREHYTMARLLAFDFPDDLAARDVKDEYMFGPALLVAPVTDPGVSSRRVYLPKFTLPNGANGVWYDTRTGAKHAAGTTVDAPAPLDSIPVFQRAGSIVVRGPVVQYSAAQRGLPLEVVVAPGDDCAFTVYDDDGETYDYEQGVFTTTKLEWSETARALKGAPEGTTVRVL